MMAEEIIQGRAEREYGAVQAEEESVAQAPLPKAPRLPLPPQPNRPVTRPPEPPAPTSQVALFTPQQLFGQQYRQIPNSPAQQRRNVGTLWEALASDPEAPEIVRIVANRLLGRDRYANR